MLHEIIHLINDILSDKIDGEEFRMLSEREKKHIKKFFKRIKFKLTWGKKNV